MERSRPTQADVARRAGVSRQLVSLVLHNDPRVSPERRGAILQAIEELGYRANAAAQSLASNRSDMVGVVVPGFANPFYAELSEALRVSGEGRGFVPLVASIAENPAREVSAIEHFIEFQVSGLILVAPLLDLDPLGAYGKLVPTVVMTRDKAPGTVDMVRFRDRANARRLTDHMLSRGYGPIVYVGFERPAEGDSSHERQRGYRDALRAAGHEATTFLAPGLDDTDRSIQGLEEVLAPGLGIVCHNDQVAINIAGLLESNGLRRGQDVGLAGFDNTALTHTLGISLTTVAHDTGAMSRIATDLIAERNQGRTEATVVTMPAKLIERSSTSGFVSTH